MRWSKAGMWLAPALAVSALGARAELPKPAQSAAERPKRADDELAALKLEFEEAREETGRLDASDSNADRSPDRLDELTRRFIVRFQALADRSKGTPTAAHALTWVVLHTRSAAEKQDGLDSLAADYLQSEALLEVCQSLGTGRTQPPAHTLRSTRVATVVPRLQMSGVERFLRAVVEKSPHHAVRGQAEYTLACVLRELVDVKEGIANANPRRISNYERRYGKELLEQLARRDDHAMRAECETLLAKVAADCADLKKYDGTLAGVAEGDLFELRRLQVGMVAPEIEGTDVGGAALKLSDLRGNVVVLEFWGFW